MAEKKRADLQVRFARRIRLQFRGVKVSADTGLLLVCCVTVTLILAIGAIGAAKGQYPVKLCLVKRGQPAATIVLAQNPTRAAQFAAAELQYHLQKITGAVLPVVSDEAEVEGTRILVGESAATEALGLRNADFQPQEYLIRLRPDALVLMGRDKDDRPADFDYNDADAFPDLFDEQGTCYAVYDFLERFCEVRWYLPTELGLVYPRGWTLVVTGTEVRRAPAMKYRWVDPGMELPADLCGDTVAGPEPIPALPWREQMLWLHRHRMGGEPYAANHSLYGYYDRFLESHPEYFAQGRGERPTQMCYSNPGLISQVVQDARDYFDGKGLQAQAFAAGDYFAVVPMDNFGWCTCSECVGQVLPQPTRGRGLCQWSPMLLPFSSNLSSDYLFDFVNQIARQLRPLYPDQYIAALAYAGYAYPPSEERLEPNVSVQLCLHARTIYHNQVQDNDREILQSWVAESKERRKFLWLYYCFPAMQANLGQWRCFPGFFAHTIVEQMGSYHQAGIRGLFYQDSYVADGRRSALLDQLEFYVTFRLADNPTLDGNQLIDEFFTRYYGAAAQPMKQMYERMEEIYANPANYPPDFDDHHSEEIAWGRLGTAERMAELGQFMEQAKRQARTNVEKRRVALFEKGIWQYMLAGREAYLQRTSTQEDASQ